MNESSTKEDGLEMLIESGLKQSEDWCEGCHALREELTKVKAEHALNYTTLKEKIISTDLLIKKYTFKCQECDVHSKKADELQRNLDKFRRDCELLETRLKTNLEETEPLKQAKDRLEASHRRHQNELQVLKDKLEASEASKRIYYIAQQDNDNKVKDLEIKLSEAKKENKEFDISHRKQETIIKRLQGEVESKKAELREQKKLLHNVTSVRDKQNQRVDQLEQLLRDYGHNVKSSRASGRRGRGSRLTPSRVVRRRADVDQAKADIDQAVSSDEELLLNKLIQDEDSDGETFNLFRPIGHALSPLPPSPPSFEDEASEDSMDEMAEVLESALSSSSRQKLARGTVERPSSPTPQRKQRRRHGQKKQSHDVEGSAKPATGDKQSMRVVKSGLSTQGVLTLQESFSDPENETEDVPFQKFSQEQRSLRADLQLSASSTSESESEAPPADVSPRRSPRRRKSTGSAREPEEIPQRRRTRSMSQESSSSGEQSDGSGTPPLPKSPKSSSPRVQNASPFKEPLPVSPRRSRRRTVSCREDLQSCTRVADRPAALRPRRVKRSISCPLGKSDQSSESEGGEAAVMKKDSKGEASVNSEEGEGEEPVIIPAPTRKRSHMEDEKSVAGDLFPQSVAKSQCIEKELDTTPGKQGKNAYLSGGESVVKVNETGLFPKNINASPQMVIKASHVDAEGQLKNDVQKAETQPNVENSEPCTETKTIGDRELRRSKLVAMKGITRIPSGDELTKESESSSSVQESPEHRPSEGIIGATGSDKSNERSPVRSGEKAGHSESKSITHTCLQAPSVEHQPLSKHTSQGFITQTFEEDVVESDEICNENADEKGDAPSEKSTFGFGSKPKLEMVPVSDDKELRVPAVRVSISEDVKLQDNKPCKVNGGTEPIQTETTNELSEGNSQERLSSEEITGKPGRANGSPESKIENPGKVSNVTEKSEGATAECPKTKAISTELSKDAKADLSKHVSGVTDSENQSAENQSEGDGTLQTDDAKASGASNIMDRSPERRRTRRRSSGAEEYVQSPGKGRGTLCRQFSVDTVQPGQKDLSVKGVSLRTKFVGTKNASIEHTSDNEEASTLKTSEDQVVENPPPGSPLIGHGDNNDKSRDDSPKASGSRSENTEGMGSSASEDSGKSESVPFNENGKVSSNKTAPSTVSPEVSSPKVVVDEKDEDRDKSGTVARATRPTTLQYQAPCASTSGAAPSLGLVPQPLLSPAVTPEGDASVRSETPNTFKTSSVMSESPMSSLPPSPMEKVECITPLSPMLPSDQSEALSPLSFTLSDTEDIGNPISPLPPSPVPMDRDEEDIDSLPEDAPLAAAPRLQGLPGGTAGRSGGTSGESAGTSDQSSPFMCLIKDPAVEQQSARQGHSPSDNAPPVYQPRVRIAHYSAQPRAQDALTNAAAKGTKGKATPGMPSKSSKAKLQRTANDSQGGDPIKKEKQQSSAGSVQSRPLPAASGSSEEQTTFSQSVEGQSEEPAKRKRGRPQKRKNTDDQAACPVASKIQCASGESSQMIVTMQRDLFSLIRRRGSSLSAVITRLLKNTSPNSRHALVQALIKVCKSQEIDLLSTLYTLCSKLNTDVAWKPFIADHEIKITQLLIQLDKSKVFKGVLCAFMEVANGVVLAPDTASVLVRASLCRIFTALCRQVGWAGRARVLLYDLVLAQVTGFPTLTVAIAGVWPQLLQRTISQGPQTLIGTLEYTVMKRVAGEKVRLTKLAFCMRALCQWVPASDDKDATYLVTHILKLLQDEAEKPAPNRDVLCELEQSLLLVARTEDWTWTNNVLVVDSMWPQLRSWAAAQTRHTHSAVNHVMCESLVRLMGHIVSRCPAEHKSAATDVMNMMRPLVLGVPGTVIPPSIQQAALESLLRLAPFAVDTVAETADAWLEEHGQAAAPAPRSGRRGSLMRAAQVAVSGGELQLRALVAHFVRAYADILPDDQFKNLRVIIK